MERLRRDLLHACRTLTLKLLLELPTRLELDTALLLLSALELLKLLLHLLELSLGALTLTLRTRRNLASLLSLLLRPRFMPLLMCGDETRLRELRCRPLKELPRASRLEEVVAPARPSAGKLPLHDPLESHLCLVLNPFGALSLQLLLSRLHRLLLGVVAAQPRNLLVCLLELIA